MPELTIRPAHPRDAARLSAIALAVKRDWGYPERWLAVWAQQLSVTPAYIRAHAVFVARGTRRLCGFCALVERPRFWELDHFWIHPDSMGQGIGRRLFARALNHVRGRGPRVLRIVSDPNAAGFYQRMGARRVGSVSVPVSGVQRRLPRLEVHF
jgi:GNAT superfamily N-acetyltransferase